MPLQGTADTCDAIAVPAAEVKRNHATLAFGGSAKAVQSPVPPPKNPPLSQFRLSANGLLHAWALERHASERSCTLARLCGHEAWQLAMPPACAGSDRPCAPTPRNDSLARSLR